MTIEATTGRMTRMMLSPSRPKTRIAPMNRTDEQHAAYHRERIGAVIFVAVFPFHGAAEIRAGLLHRGAIRLVDLSAGRPPVALHRGKNGRFAGRNRGGLGLFGAGDDKRRLQVFQERRRPPTAELEGRGRERRPTLAGKALVVDIVDQRRWNAVGRVPSGNEHAASRVAADLQPHAGVVARDDHQPGDPQNPVQVVPAPARCFPARRRAGRCCPSAS